MKYQVKCYHRTRRMCGISDPIEASDPESAIQQYWNNFGQYKNINHYGCVAIEFTDESLYSKSK